MGTRGREILQESGIDVLQLIKMLNQAFADEWLAYYQYWLGAKVAVGIPKEAVVAELTQHANDELRHASLVADRIIQLGGVPLLEPKVWFDYATCEYDPPEDPNVRVLVDQNIKGEQCAIGVYKKIMDYTRDKDPITYNMALLILTDEIAHEEDLEAIKADIQMMLVGKE